MPRTQLGECVKDTVRGSVLGRQLGECAKDTAMGVC